MAKQKVTPEARQERLTSVESLLEKLAAIEPQSLGRREELSATINFEEAVPTLTELLDITRQLNDRDLSRLPTDHLDRVLSGATQLDNQIKLVREFDLNTNTPGDACQAIIASIKQAYDGVVSPLVLPLAFTATQATDYPKLEREAKGCLATMQAEATELKGHLANVRSEAEKALSAVKEQAAEAGVATNAHIFASHAKSHEVSAKAWLKGTISIGVIAVLLALGGVAIAFAYQPPSTGAAIQFVVAKVIFLSMLSFVLVWCSRNYKAHKHNETLNEHRANALMTFRAFIEGTSDPAVRDAILLHAAQAAFAPRPTAFDSNETDHQPINPVVEIFGKALTQSTKLQ